MLDSKFLSEEARKIYPAGVDCHLGKEYNENGILLDFVDKVTQDDDGNDTQPSHEITVDGMLDNLDLKLEWYEPSSDAIEYMIFIRQVLGEEPENSNPIAHYFFIDSIFHSPNVEPFYYVRNIDYDALDQETVVLCSREFSKTTLITYLILFMAAKGRRPGFGSVNYGLYVSDSMRNGVKKMMLRLRGVYNESEYLQGIFEEVSITIEDAIFIRNPSTKKEIKLYEEYVVRQKKKPENVPGRMKRTFKVDGLGCMTSSRGASNVLVRPQFVFIDDVVANETDATSQVILDSIESTIEADIRGGLSGNGYFIIAIGTPYNKSDPIYRRIEEGLMLPIVFPRAEKMPTDDIKEKDFVSVWPDRHTYKKCRREYVNARTTELKGNSYKMRKLTQEHYLRIANESDRLVPESLLQWFDRNYIIENSWAYNWFITTDYTSKRDVGSDFSGAMLWALGNNGDWFLIDMVLRKMGLEEQYDETFRLNSMYDENRRVAEVGVEVDGQQDVHIYSLKELMVKKNEYFIFAKQKGATKGKIGIRSGADKTSKHWRFKNTVPMFQNGKIWFAKQLKETPDMKELLEEIKYATYKALTSKHDDGLDCISQIAMIDAIAPSKNATKGIANIKKKASTKGLGFWKTRELGREEDSSAYSSYVTS